MNRSLFRFFWVVSPHPAYVLAGFCALAALGTWSLSLNPDDVESAFDPLLFFQMFAASAGFRAPASRGHYDAALVTGIGRARIAIAHFLVSILPALATWAFLATAEIVASSGRHAHALEARSVIALLLVSAVSWAIGLGLPRLGAGVIWTVMLLIVAVTRERLVEELNALMVSPVPPLRDLPALAGVVALCPFLLLTSAPAVRRPALLSAIGGLALASMLCGVAYVAWRDYTLVQDL